MSPSEAFPGVALHFVFSRVKLQHLGGLTNADEPLFEMVKDSEPLFIAGW